MTAMDDKLGAQGDEFYNLLMDAHDGLSETDSHRLNARLVLMMANQIGDLETLRDLIKTARDYTP
jgi:hypothetical protein